MLSVDSRILKCSKIHGSPGDFWGLHKEVMRLWMCRVVSNHTGWLIYHSWGDQALQ
jgi:hypothetical protein